MTSNKKKSLEQQPSLLGWRMTQSGVRATTTMVEFKESRGTSVNVIPPVALWVLTLLVARGQLMTPKLPTIVSGRY
ncbi:MAG: hypothetical protein ABJQ38_18220, partial [Flavobacteriaceae bacterium]